MLDSLACIPFQSKVGPDSDQDQYSPGGNIGKQFMIGNYFTYFII